MNLNKREKTLVIILLLIIIGFIYLRYMINPLTAEIQKLQVEKESSIETLDTMNKTIDEKDLYIKQYNEHLEKILELSNQYYVELLQDDFVVLLNNYAEDSNVDVSSFNFNDRSESFDHKNLLSIEMNYNAVEDDLYEFIGKVQRHIKKINVSQLSVAAENDKNVSGNVELDFNSILLLNKYKDEMYEFDLANNIINKQYSSPYVPYYSLSEKMEYSESEMNKVDLYLQSRTVRNINGFHSTPLFFVGTDNEISGNISKVSDGLHGNHSIRFKYDFGIKKPFFEANLVFRNNLIINDHNDYVSLWVKSEDVTNHKLGLVVVDSLGESYDLTLTSNVDFEGWEVLEAELPLEIRYPCKVQRIYVSSTDYDQTLNGTLIFDQLQIANEKDLEDYAKEEGDSNE